VIKVSARTGEGFDELCDKIKELFCGGSIDYSSPAILNVRQKNSLSRAYEALCCAKNALELGYTEDAVCLDIEEAMGRLLALDGRRVGEDIVNEIFSRFCVGK